MYLIFQYRRCMTPHRRDAKQDAKPACNQETLTRTDSSAEKNLNSLLNLLSEKSWLNSSKKSCQGKSEKESKGKSIGGVTLCTGTDTLVSETDEEGSDISDIWMLDDSDIEIKSEGGTPPETPRTIEESIVLTSSEDEDEEVKELKNLLAMVKNIK
ncbi:MAG: hypothetical protein [Upsilontorquevirus procy2]|uniref:Uncharacterized protein n=1 Tax=Anelloviridae sp. TaxID=2055263 RepID=A0A3G2YTR2_9VIRU|nr:MAG: hypothetical protein QKC68_gp1 [Anelloviridae sp.]AYP28952.1 MAG: hypothetical protein [Anelloviridae sp.]